MHTFTIISVLLIVLLGYTLIDINDHYLKYTNNSVEKLMHDTNYKSKRQYKNEKQDNTTCNPVTLENFGKYKQNRSRMI